jgi:glycosyltransferase involved in cell wall biosynthesis
MKFSVLVATYNRAVHLEDTLRHLARIETCDPWEAIVIDNNSPDNTREVVERLSRDFPVPLRYLHEPKQGKYGALNAGIRAARGRILAATDDDARVAPDWLDRAAAGLTVHDCAFVGGVVRPRWEGVPPAWLDWRNAAVQKVIAIQDHGPVAKEYGHAIGWPLGVNVAYRREAFERAGLFDPSLGRTAGTLRSQSQREWHLRARAAGLRGFYLPDMFVQHLVVAERLTREYFRRWHYWNGISRAHLYWRFGFDPEEPEKVRYDVPLPDVGGVPRHLIRKAALAVRSYLWRTLRREPALAFEHEITLSFVAGFSHGCRRLRHQSFAAEFVPAQAPERDRIVA